METKNETRFNWSFFKELPVVGILRGIPLEDIVQILPICAAAGLRNIEITMNSVDVEKSMAHALEHFVGQLNIGAGTVCSLDDLEKALAHGASFIVTPNMDEAVIAQCVKVGVPIFPGAFSPSEIHRAWSLGASMVKVFPMEALGPKYLKSIKAPFDSIKLLPTGGIDASNVLEYFGSGADGVGVSSGLFDKEMVNKRDWAALEEHIKTFVSRIS